jgi:hypothetical protein
MSKLSEVDKRLINGVISSIDWDQIAKFYKILNKKIGYEQVKIKGITRNDKITTDSLQEELLRVLEYVIDNDLPEMSYGPWLIIWTNGEWEIMESIQAGLEESQEEIQIPIMESKLQVHFIPQTVTMKEDVDLPQDFFEMDDDTVILEGRLKTCIEQEDYVLAGKIRDVIEELNKRKK